MPEHYLRTLHRVLRDVCELVLATGLLILASPTFANSESPPWPPNHPSGWGQYWTSRRILTIVAYRSHRGTLDSTVVLDNAGSPASADSVRRSIERALRVREGDPVEFLQICLDSSAHSFPDRQGVPGFVARRLSSGLFHEWMKGLDPRDPKGARDGFAAVSVDSFFAPGFRNALSGPYAENKKRFGLLAISPESTYVLDSFAEVGFDSVGTPEYDAEGWGYGVIDAKSGDVLAWSETGPFHLGGWIDKTRFLLVGQVRLDSPVKIPGTYLFAFAPMICVGDVEKHVVVSYLGQPIDSDVQARLNGVRHLAYPRIKW